MGKTFLVAKRELIENLRTKGFWIGIFIFPVLLTVMIVVPTLLEKTKSARSYAVIDNSGWLLDAVRERADVGDLTLALMEAAEKAGDNKTDELPLPLADVAPLLEDLQPGVLSVAAAAIVGGPDSPTQIPPGTEELMDHRDDLRSWITGLSSSDARNLSSRMNRARYELVDAQGRTEEDLNQAISNDELFAYIVLGQDPVRGTEPARYVSNNLTDDDLQRWFRNTATQIVRERRLAQENIDPAVASWIQTPLAMEARKIGDTGTQEEVSTTDTIRQWAPVVFLYLLWISIFTSSQMLLTNTIEEKSNRIIEVLLSSVSPMQLMVGKIAGIAMSGLILVGSWMGMFYFGTKLIPRFVGEAPSFDLSVIATDPTFVLSFIVYFLLGYLLYSSLLVAIGSVVNTIKEAQNLMGPITLLLMAPLAAMVPIGRDPNGMLARVMSYIPPFTPFAMMNRAAGPPTTFEYISTTILLVVSVAAAMWAAAKVFRIGVLLTGKPPKIGEIFRWIKAPVGAIPEVGD